MRIQKLAAILGALGANLAWAIPELQIDILGGTYIGGSEQSTVANSPVFTVRALLKGAANLAGPYYLSAGIEPGLAQTFPAPNLGSFILEGVTYTSSMLNYGTPPVNIPDINPGDLAPHGVYPSYYAEIVFNFSSSQTVAAYNTQDGSAGAGVLYYQDFLVDVSNLAPGYFVHFDLYDEKVKKNQGWTIDDFAPFSHDARSGGGVEVPDEGSTLILIGLAFFGISALRHRFGKS